MGSSDKLNGWFAGRLPNDLYASAPEISYDREEIIIIGELSEPELDADASEEAVGAARSGRIKQHREDTRGKRMTIASEAEHRFGRKVSWGAKCGDQVELFTTLSAPVMTRLRMKDRQVLDALVDAGVARSRSHALAWCVRLVGKNESEWLGKLKEALTQVEEARRGGPEVS